MFEITCIIVCCFLCVFIMHCRRQNQRENACVKHEYFLHYFDGPPYGCGRYGQVTCQYCGKTFGKAMITNWRGDEASAAEKLQQELQKAIS